METLPVQIPVEIVKRWLEARANPSIPKWSSLACFAADLADKELMRDPLAFQGAVLLGIATKAHDHMLNLQPKEKS